MPNEETLQPGDVVYLKSGGPPMTVTAAESAGNILVCWSIGGPVARDLFPIACLTKKRPLAKG